MHVRLLNNTRENIEQHGRRQLSKFGGGLLNKGVGAGGRSPPSTGRGSGGAL